MISAVTVSLIRYPLNMSPVREDEKKLPEGGADWNSLQLHLFTNPTPNSKSVFNFTPTYFSAFVAFMCK